MNTFGVREVCDVKLKALRNISDCQSITGKPISKGEPIVYFDYLKVSNLTGAGTTVYATGGKGNARRLSWDGDKEVTFHVEDALLSPESLAVLTGASIRKRTIVQTVIEPVGENATWNITYDADTKTNIISLKNTNFDSRTFIDWVKIEVDDPANAGTALRIDATKIEYDSTAKTIAINTVDGEIATVNSIVVQSATSGKATYLPKKTVVYCDVDGEIVINDKIERDNKHPLFIFDEQSDGSIDKINTLTGVDGSVSDAQTSISVEEIKDADSGRVSYKTTIKHPNLIASNKYLVDYYRKNTGNVTSLVITSQYMSEYYKLEGIGLMKSNTTGQDVPVVLTMPKVKMTSNWEIPMSNTGDPSVFTFDFDVFPANSPDYESCEDNVMVIIDIIEDTEDVDCNCVFIGAEA